MSLLKVLLEIFAFLEECPCSLSNLFLRTFVAQSFDRQTQIELPLTHFSSIKVHQTLFGELHSPHVLLSFHHAFGICPFSSPPAGFPLSYSALSGRLGGSRWGWVLRINFRATTLAKVGHLRAILHALSRASDVLNADVLSLV